MAVNRVFSSMLKKHPGLSFPSYNWDIEPVLNNRRAYSNYAVLVLNRPITQGQAFLTNLWNNAAVRVTVDGGTKKWDMFVEHLPEKDKNAIKLPDLVTGDFDSIPKEIFEKYKKKGCEMVHTPDQNHTDFTKALIELNIYCQTHKLKTEHIIAIGQSSGRIDQVLGNIQTLYLVKEKKLLDPLMKVYLLSDDSVSWLLYPGKHVINIPDVSLQHKRVWCSLVPIGEPCDSVTTSGLKWNLSQQSLKFGDLVSTSNAFDGSKVVTIICSHTILWSMKIPVLID